MFGWSKKSPRLTPVRETAARQPTDQLDLPRELSVDVVYVDEHLIELAAVVNVDEWRGHTTAYATSEEVARFAKALREFALGGPPASFNLGAE